MPTPIRTRPYNLLRQLLARGHRVTLLTLFENSAEEEMIQTWETIGARVVAQALGRGRKLANALQGLFSDKPIQSHYCWSLALARALGMALADDEPYDVVHVEHLRGARYAELAHRRTCAGRLPTRVVWDSVDCISFLFRQARAFSTSAFGRIVTRFELPRTERYEARLAQTLCPILVSSVRDQHALRQLANGGNGTASAEADTCDTRIHVLRNGVDLEYFRCDNTTRAPATIVFSGKMSYHANVTAAEVLVRQIMPRVWQHMPEARVQIVGHQPTAQVYALQRENPTRVEVTGTVKDIRPYLSQATLAIAPITYGAGIQNKVLEAMAMGAPVVATPTAVAALDVQDRRELRIGSQPDELAHHVLALLNNPVERHALAKHAYQYVRQNHDWQQICSRLEEIYTSGR